MWGKFRKNLSYIDYNIRAHISGSKPSYVISKTTARIFTKKSLTLNPYSFLHCSPNGGRRRANLALYLAILLNRSSLNLKTKQTSHFVHKTYSIFNHQENHFDLMICCGTHLARTFLARSTCLFKSSESDNCFTDSSSWRSSKSWIN